MGADQAVPGAEPEIVYVDDEGREYTRQEATRRALADGLRKQAARAAQTPEQKEARAQFYRRQHEDYLARTATKRAMGYGDCSAELATSSRVAARAVARKFPNIMGQKPAGPRAHAREKRPEGRRRAGASSSSSSSDPGGADSEGDGEPHHDSDVAPFDRIALGYLEAHAISPTVALELGVRQDGGSIVFPYDGFERRRSLTGEGPKMRQPKGSPLALWQPRRLADGRTAALLTEGESDALAALSALQRASLGELRDLAVCAIPGTGMPADRAAETLAEAGITQLWLAFDADAAGLKYRSTLVPTLLSIGIRPFVVELPDGRDLADVLAGMQESDRGDWIASALMDASAAAEEQEQTNSAPTPDDAGTLRWLDVGRMTRERPPDVPWVIEGLVVRGMVTVLNGREGEGKSLLCGALAAGVATGTAEAGMACGQGGVVVVDAENGAYEIHRRVHTLDLPAHGIDIYEADGFDLRSGLGELEAVLECHRPALLVLDSFRSLWRGEENDSREVAAALDPLRNLVRRYQVGTVLLHHSGKGNGAQYRGSSAIGASCELGFKLARQQDDDQRDRRYLECWKCRPAPEPPRRWLALQIEGGRVYIDKAEPPDGNAEPERAAPVRAELRPQVLGVLRDEPLARADIARAASRDPKDRSVGRVLEQLLNEGLADKSGPDTRPLWRKVAGGNAPIGACHPATNGRPATFESGSEQ